MAAVAPTLLDLRADLILPCMMALLRLTQGMRIVKCRLDSEWKFSAGRGDSKADPATQAEKQVPREMTDGRIPQHRPPCSRRYHARDSTLKPHTLRPASLDQEDAGSDSSRARMPGSPTQYPGTGHCVLRTAPPAVAQSPCSCPPPGPLLPMTEPFLCELPLLSWSFHPARSECLATFFPWLSSFSPFCIASIVFLVSLTHAGCSDLKLFQ